MARLKKNGHQRECSRWESGFFSVPKRSFVERKSIVRKLTLKVMRWPGIEPGSTAWKAAKLTIIPPTLDIPL